MKATQTQTKSMQAYIDKMHTLGATIASVFIAADHKADLTKREMLLTSAETHADKVESVKHILEGFASKLEHEGYTANVIKQRKAEANAVYKCVGQTAVTKDHLKALKAFDGGYHAFIELARKLRDEFDNKDKVTDVNAPSARATKVRPLTSTQMQNVTDSLKKANVTELETISENVVNELNRVADVSIAQLAQFKLIASVSNSIINNESFDKVSHDVATNVFKQVNIHINRLEKAQEKANAVQQEAAATQKVANA
jgi:hypothetical protein